MSVPHTLGSIALQLGDGLGLLDICHCEKFDYVTEENGSREKGEG